MTTTDDTIEDKNKVENGESCLFRLIDKFDIGLHIFLDSLVSILWYMNF